MKHLFFILILLPLMALSQVGIRTGSPQASLDVREINSATPTPSAGISIPQVSVLPSSGNRAGQLIFLTTDPNYYYFNGTRWIPLMSKHIIGDMEQDMESTDHLGWVKLDG